MNVEYMLRAWIQIKRQQKKSELKSNSLSVMNHHQSFLLVVSITFLASG